MASPVPNKNDGSANARPIAYQTLAADGAITLGKNLVYLTKAGATAATLAAPTNPDMNGQSIEICVKTNTCSNPVLYRAALFDNLYH